MGILIDYANFIGVDPANASFERHGIEQLRYMCFIFKDQIKIRGTYYLCVIDP